MVNVKRNALPLLFKGEYEYLNDNYFNIQNILNGHEYKHYEDFVKSGYDKSKYAPLGKKNFENNAFQAQINHWTWRNTTPAFKFNAKKYNGNYNVE